MKQLFRQPGSGLSGYVALMLFALVYLATVAVVIAPETVLSAFGTPETGSPAEAP